jgi:ATP-dependent DNA helicase RecG
MSRIFNQRVEISEREGRQLEYKEKLDDYQAIVRTAVAFLNDIGGRIIIGVRDRSLKITGLSVEEVDRHLERIPQALHDSISPFFRPEVRAIVFGKKTVLEVLVSPGQHKPYYVASLGKAQGVFIRVGAHTKRANSGLIAELERQGIGRHYDEEPLVAYDEEIGDPDLIKSFYHRSSPSQEHLLADKVMVVDRITSEPKLSVAGVIFFARSPERFMPQAEILFSRFGSGKAGAKLLTKDISGPLEVQLDLVLELLVKELAVEQVVRGARLETTKLEVPLAAIREVLLNALVHRRYDIQDAIKVSVYSDRVEVFSPGNFPGPITDFLGGVSYSRNPTLRQLARKRGLVEKRGLGFRTIFSACHENCNPEPLIEERELGVRVVLYRKRLAQKRILPEEYTALEPLLKCEEGFQTSEVAQVLGVSSNTARSVLKKLADDGLIKTFGKGRGAKWIINR